MKCSSIPMLAMACAFLSLTTGSVAFGQYARYPTLSGDIEPLHIDKMPPWLTLDMSLRARAEFQSSINLKPGDSPTYELTRVRIGFRVQPVQWLNAYIQIHDAHAVGLTPVDTNANMKDTFDLRQALISLKHARTQLIVGRQPLRFADERLVGISDWTNVSRTFDAIMLATDGKNRVSVFTSSVVNIYPERADRADGGLHFHGVVGALDSVLPRTSLQPFLFVKTNLGVTSPLSQNGSETAFTFGGFVAGDLPGSVFYSGTGVLQRGRYADQNVEAGGSIIRVGYTARKLPLAPEIRGEYDYATGNDGQVVSRRKTFDQLYPSDHAVFGLVDLFGWQNIKLRKADITAMPHKGLSLILAAESLHLASRHDAAYSGSGAALVSPPSGGFHADGIGSAIDFSAKYVVHDFVTNAGVGHFNPGSVMTSGAKSSPLTIAYLSFTYRFSIQHDKELHHAPGNTEHHVPQRESDDE